jgi:hypothetical protein
VRKKVEVRVAQKAASLTRWQRVKRWLIRTWRRGLGRCPNCGGTEEVGISGLSLASRCACGFFASYMMDGSRMEYYPEGH